MTRVLFLTESFHPVLGGGENHIRMLATRLATLGQATLVLTRRGRRDWPSEEVLDGIRVLRVPPAGPGRLGKYAMVPGILWALVARRADYDLIVVRGGRVLGIPGLVAARLLRKPFVAQPEVTGELSGDIYTWGTPFHRPWVQRVVKALMVPRNLVLRGADAFVAISTAIQQEIVAAGAATERVALIPHGVDTRRFRPADSREKMDLRRVVGLPEGGELVVFTGRLLRGKGIEILLDAFERVVEVRREARLVLVGDGGDQTLSVEKALRARVADGALATRVTFAGRVENVEDYLRAADVFAFPSFFEAMPLSVLEATSCGLACVASAVGGIVDVIEDGRSGILLPPGDADALARTLTSLLGDAAKRSALGSSARERAVALFDFDATVGRYATLFEDLVAARRAA